MTDSIEQRTIAVLYGRGDMANLDCDGQRALEYNSETPAQRVRQETKELFA